MKLYFRLLLLLFRLRKLNTIAIDDTSVLQSRVWPTDLDFNGHMTNTRYGSLFDLSHIQLFSQLGVIPILKKKRWTPVINARTISYFKELSPFERFSVTSKLIYWDRSYFYMEQRVVNQNGKTSAICYSRGLIIEKDTRSKAIIPIKQILLTAYSNALNKAITDEQQTESPVIPEHIQNWKDTLTIQKKTAKTI